MRFKIISVRDRAVDSFGSPFVVTNLGGAIRSFGDEVKRPHSPERPNPYNQHPEDYDLYCLGEFDSDTGEFSAQRPEQIAIGKDYI